MGKLQEYQRVVERAERDFQVSLSNGRASAREVAIARRTLQIMKEVLKVSPGSAMVFEKMRPLNSSMYSGPDAWYLAVFKQAGDELYPHLASETASKAYQDKRMEYLELGINIVQSSDARQRSVVDRQRGKSYLYSENVLVPKIMRIIASELILWYENYPVDREFVRRGQYLTWPARAGLGLFLSERSDMVALLRLAQTLPYDTEVGNVPIERPAVVEIVELAIGLIPVVGSIVAAYEAYAGEDLFGYHLSDLERGILAATVLLPLAGRVVKGGRILYTEARMISLYGRDAAAWSRTIKAGSQATAGARALRVVEEAEVALRVQHNLERGLAQRAAKELPNVLRAAAPVATSADNVVTTMFRELSQRFNTLRTLDEFALQRVLSKGPNVDHLKGQLLEEIVEARIVPWLRDRAGSFALGIETGGRQLEFIPGHLIRDASGRQITDGILAFRNNGVLEIAAIFEAKAGNSAARELSITRASISSLNTAERAELRAFARDIWRDARTAAQEKGVPYTKTIEEIEREVILTERGGQVRRDIERLSPGNGGALPGIRIGSDLVPVKISPTKTKFFGILPKDARRSLIESELRAGGFNFEIIGVDVTQRELKSIAEEMVPLATTMANTP